MKKAICLLFFGLLSISLRAQVPQSERVVSYHIKVRLDPERKTLIGTQTMTWRNTGPTPVQALQFHLYLNAFRDAKSTFMRESGGEHRGFKTGGKDTWGRIDLINIRQTNGPDLRSRLYFIRPDDGNPNDFTVAALS
ncbi:MAG TPA: hypothetical protein PLL64_13255, partial [Rhodothermales bacterium]|nr:hypothetical protein [Rhodothermales bacterium]